MKEVIFEQANIQVENSVRHYCSKHQCAALFLTRHLVNKKEVWKFWVKSHISKEPLLLNYFNHPEDFPLWFLGTPCYKDFPFINHTNYFNYE